MTSVAPIRARVDEETNPAAREHPRTSLRSTCWQRVGGGRDGSRKTMRSSEAIGKLRSCIIVRPACECRPIAGWYSTLTKNDLIQRHFIDTMRQNLLERSNSYTTSRMIFPLKTHKHQFHQRRVSRNNSRIGICGHLSMSVLHFRPRIHL